LFDPKANIHIDVGTYGENFTYYTKRQSVDRLRGLDTLPDLLDSTHEHLSANISRPKSVWISMEELARGASIKTIMAWAGAGERTVKEWLAGSNAPRAL
jgi:hypothetical protein